MKDTHDNGPTDAQLIEFARLTLYTLQSDEDWSSDTTDAIAEHAFNLRLADTSRDGYFTSLIP